MKKVLTNYSTFSTFIIAVLFYILIWTEEAPPVIDPWYEAVQMVDSSKKINNSILKSKLLNNGGNRLKKLVSEYPFHARVHFFLGYYYHLEKKYDSAIAEYDLAIRIDSGSMMNPVYHDAIRQLVIAAIERSSDKISTAKYEEALSDLQPAFKYSNINPEINAQLGIIYHKMAILDSAEIYYLKSLKLKPDFYLVKQNLAQLYFVKGNKELLNSNYKKALEYYSKSGKLVSNNVELYSNAATAFLKSGNIHSAIQFYNKALEINPSFRSALKNLELIYRKSGDNSKADMYATRLNRAAR